MRRQSTLEQYDTDIDGGPSQATLRALRTDDDALPNSSTCFPIDDHGDYRWGTVQADDNNSQKPWNNDPASISVNVSLLRQLCAAGHADERQNSEKSTSTTSLTPRPPSGLGAVTVVVEEVAADVEEDDVDVDDPEREHEERRILERFASFPSGRPATPKNRRRNKRKGSDSPRQLHAEIPPAAAAGYLQPTTSTTSSSCSDDKSSASFIGGGCRGAQQPSFNLAQLHDHSGGNEPVTSHTMRPARRWPSLLDFPDNDDEEVTVSPRVLSPETEEASGSFHGQRFAGCEQRERRTTFIALGRLRMSNRSSSSTNNSNSVNNLRNISSSSSSSSSSSNMEVDEHPAALRAKQLVALINSLKEKVKLYEDAFEQRYGYRPSHHHKMDDRNQKRILTELARSRKELKQLKERHHISDVDAVVESSIDIAHSRPFPDPSIEHTVLDIQEHLAGNRKLAGRPEAVEELNAQEILDEKLAVQRALLYVESIHGRPASFRQKDLLRPLYNRYRILKRMVLRSRLSRTKEESSELAPILEHETLELAPPTPSLEMGLADEGCGGAQAAADAQSWPSQDQQPANKDLVICKRQKISLNIEENLHALPLNQLVEQLRHVREEKRQLRRSMRDLGADILRKGTSSTFSSTTDAADGHLEPFQAQYRHVRAKLRLLEALVAKHDGSATL